MVAAVLLAAMTASPNGAGSTTVPFALFDNRMLVAVSIDGRGPFTMVVDTGSGSLVITPSVAARLRVGARPAGSVIGAGSGSAQRALTQVQNVAIGGMRFRNVPAEVIDLSPIRRAIGFPRLDGIIGYNILRNLRFGVDMDDQRLTLSSSPISVPARAISVPFKLGADALIRVHGAIDGVHGSFIVDTGDHFSLTLFRHFAQANNFYSDAITRNAVTGYGVGGPIYSDVLRTTVSLFGSTLSGVVTRASRDKGGAFALGSDDASVGQGLLRRFNIVYDYPDSKLYAWPSHLFAAKDIFERLVVAASPPPSLPRHAVFGAGVAAATGGVRVTFLVPGAPAAQAGVRAGDTIRALGATPTASVAAFLDAVHILRAGQRIAVDVVRKGAPLRLYAVLAAARDENDAGLVTQYGAIAVDDSPRRTLLTMPQGLSSPAPAVLLIGGIGCYTVDVAANSQDAYLHLTHDLARAGFVTMRIEKSGVGDSHGPPCRNVDFDAEVRGYAAALAALQRNALVNPARVYLLGHSIGTVIAPGLAAANRVAGVIVVEAVGRDWPEYEIRNLRRDLELDGDGAAATDRALTEKAECMQQLLFEYKTEEVVDRGMPACRVHDNVYPVTAAYMQQVAHRNVIEPWTKLNLPVLAVFGTSDFETELADHQRIVDVVNAAHPSSATLVVIAGMSHGLGRAVTSKDALNDDARGTIEAYDTEASATIVAWLRSRP